MGRRNEDGKRITKKGNNKTSYDKYGKYNGRYIRRIEEREESSPYKNQEECVTKNKGNDKNKRSK